MPLVSSLCPPAMLYLGFSIIQIIVDLFRSDHVTAFFKFLITLVFLFILQNLCDSGLSIISWFIVFIPFIMMTYVSSIVLYLFGMKPTDKSGKITKGNKEPEPDYFNKAGIKPGYPTNPASGMSSENEQLNVKI